MILYHYKIKHYFYWVNIAEQKETFFDFSTPRLLIASLIFYYDLYVLLRLDREKLNYTVAGIIFALLTVPSLVAYTSSNMYSVAIMLFHQLFFFSITLSGKIKIDFSRIPRLNKKQALTLLFVITTIGLLPYIIVFGPHINVKNLFLIDVYETRRVMEKLSTPYFGYTYSLFTKVIVPLLIVFALELKNKLLLIAGVLYLLLFYLFGAHKTVYVALFVVLFFYRFNYGNIVRLLAKYSIYLILACIVLALLTYDYLWILSIRRVHFIPTLLDICYFDFFEDRAIYWSETILKRFIDYPFDLSHTNLIGEKYFNRPSMAANNGLISDGYMNAGKIGVIINILLVSLYFMILNNLKISPRYFGLFLLIIFSFISSSTTTVFLTHGAIALLLISIFILNEKKTKNLPPNIGTRKK